jgi:fluoride exporter
VTLIGVALAGALGAVARYVVDVLIADRSRADLPVGTLVINVSGSLLLGILTGLALYHGLASRPRVVLGTGFCGGFTTFSTFTWETMALAAARQPRTAVTNVIASLALPAAAAAIGLAITAL